MTRPKRYFTGRACRRGHIVERYTANGTCVECHRQQVAGAARRSYHKLKDTKGFREERKKKRLSFVARHPHWARAYRAKNKALIRLAKASRKKIISVGVVPSDIDRIFELQNGRCVYCRVRIVPRGRHGERYEIDHIQPLCAGGSHEPGNIQLTCGPCNRKKGRRNPMEFAQALGVTT